MTAPVITLTHIIGSANHYGTGVRNKVKKSAIQGMAVRPWEDAIFDAEGYHIGWTPLRHCVMAVTASGLEVRVADFVTQAEAQTFVNNDPSGVLA